MNDQNSELDKTDQRILATLQDDGRIANTELAERIGLSPTATAERVKRLTRDGVITGYHATLNPEKLGLGFLIFIEVKLERISPDVFETFSKAVREAPEVMECHMIAGGFDYLVKARVPNMDAYRRFLSDVMLALPGVRETSSFTVMEEIKTGDRLSV